MEVGIIGLGKMGSNLAFNLKDHKYDVKGMDMSEEALNSAMKGGINTFQTVDELLASFKGKRVIWMMLPAGNPTESVLDYLLPLLAPQDIVIEGGNSNYKDSIRRSEKFAKKEISYFDCGTSGGISGARKDACLMIGGDKEVFESIEQLFKDISIESGYLYSGASGSGHFLKMVHNGIEYGMMQAIGEGFQIVEKSDFDFDLAEVARVWNHGSVIRSWLMEIAEIQFRSSPRLEDYRGKVAASGEAKWAVETALEMGIPVPTIALSLFMRNLSQEEDNFSVKVVSALRNGFGGHEVVKKD
ncbi:phosphogluconate dehydrogenase (NAD(+)-dependent, decarboxylating) [Carnobacterium funditum]|uniref:phosphogluconate dehydrogenase (NAD(+)-dependent, decarboxylating) n=1 Tax=Carnobacterium funditum TaxID=2752 RepID=UPI00055728D8|nr:decarboxylating 6-phosphogluconate dehydrogenase [Carnobacterium funditum]